MKREILFRGKSYTDGKWHYGYYMYRFATPFSPERHEITELSGLGYNCIPETVGQYTGLTDKNGKRIFERDICNCRKFECVGKIEWCEYDASFDFYVLCGGGVYDSENLYDYADELEIIGNCYDNPELLEVES